MFVSVVGLIVMMMILLLVTSGAMYVVNWVRLVLVVL